MIYFLDASAMVKRYIAEAGSEVVRSVLRRRARLSVSRISAVEVTAALAKRARSGDLSNAAAKRCAAAFNRDLSALLVVEPRPRVTEMAGELVWRHPLRAYDALQLASALHLAHETRLATTFVAADRELLAAARREGLRVLLTA